MNRFDYCLAFVLRAEGGFSNHRADRGGTTNHGVTQKTYDTFRRNAGLSLRSVKLITSDEVRGVYRTMYWNVAKCGVLPPPLDLYVFDFAVNSGPGRAVKTLQGLLGVAADGDIGPVTIAALQEEVAAGLLPELCNNYLAARLDFVLDVADGPDDILDMAPDEPAVFLQGWRNRIELLRTA